MLPFLPFLRFKLVLAYGWFPPSEQVVFKQFFDLLFNFYQDFVFDIDIHVDFNRLVWRLDLDGRCACRTEKQYSYQNY